MILCNSTNADLYVLQHQHWGHAVAWLRHCGTSRKVAGSIPDGVIYITLPAAFWPWG